MIYIFTPLERKPRLLGGVYIARVGFKAPPELSNGVYYTFNGEKWESDLSS
jgi:hypothetical protein